MSEEAINKMVMMMNVCCDASAGPKVTYVPPPPPEDETSIFSQFQKGVNFDKFDNIQVEVRGRDPPPAIMVRINAYHIG